MSYKTSTLSPCGHDSYPIIVTKIPINMWVTAQKQEARTISNTSQVLLVILSDIVML